MEGNDCTPLTITRSQKDNLLSLLFLAINKHISSPENLITLSWHIDFEKHNDSSIQRRANRFDTQIHQTYSRLTQSWVEYLHASINLALAKRQKRYSFIFLALTSNEPISSPKKLITLSWRIGFEKHNASSIQRRTNRFDTPIRQTYSRLTQSWIECWYTSINYEPAKNRLSSFQLF